MKIDCHNHVLPDEAVNLLAREPAYRARVNGLVITGEGHSDFRNGLRLRPQFYDPAAKLADLAARGIGGAVVSVTPPLFYYDTESTAGARMCEAVNEGLERFCSYDNSRLRWYAHVPLQEPARAGQLLEEAIARGAVGVEVGTSIAGKRLDDPSVAPFWEVADRMRTVVQIHPAFNHPHPGLDDWYLQNSIGNLVETTIAIERLICAGVLDRYEHVRILLVHAGGFVPYQLGRLEHTVRVRKELRNVRDPWSYLDRLWFDTITHDEQALAYLVSRVGARRVVFGTDLPYDMAPADPTDQLQRAVGAATASAVLEDNAAALFAGANDRTA